MEESNSTKEIKRNAFFAFTGQREENHVPLKKRAFIFAAAVVLICGITALALLTGYVKNFALRTVLLVLINFSMAAAAAVAARLSGMDLRKHFDFGNWKQYVFALIPCAVTVGAVLVCYAFGINLFGQSQFAVSALVYDLLFYYLVIGPAEELIFRVYIQEALADMLPKAKWVSVIIASLMFGFWHLITDFNLFKVLVTAIIGGVFGAFKYRFENCTYLSVAIAHGSHDFLMSLFAFTLAR